MIDNPVSEFLGFVREAREEAAAKAAEKNRLLSYWCNLFDEFLCTPQEFYAAVEENLANRQIPNLEGGYIAMRESNLFSKTRLYLQMRRERLVFEVCAAQFGTGYFVSSRLFDRRKQATMLDYVIAGLALTGFGIWIGTQFDYIIAIVLLGFVVTTFWSFMRLAAVQTLSWLDERLYSMPCVGPIYESLFYPETYFRQDQNSMYQEAVHRSVMAAVDAATKKRGLKPLTDEEKKPSVRELFRR